MLVTLIPSDDFILLPLMVNDYLLAIGTDPINGINLHVTLVHMVLLQKMVLHKN